MKYAEKKIICVCKDVYRIYEGDHVDNLFKCLSTLKNRKLIFKKELVNKISIKIQNLNKMNIITQQKVNINIENHCMRIVKG